MSKKVVLVGHCGADNSYLKLAVRAAAKDAEIVSADDQDALARALAVGVDLLLLNRTLDFGFEQTEGIELLKQLKQRHPLLKVMLVSNYGDAQRDAVAAGALPGFGKRELGSPRVAALIRQSLE